MEKQRKQANRVLVSLKELGPEARKQAKASGLSLPAWITTTIAEKLGKPAPKLGRGLQQVAPKLRKQIAKAGAAAMHEAKS